MYEYLKQEKIYGDYTFYEYICDKKIGIWGTGSALEKVMPWLKDLGINNITFFDNDASKQNEKILSPNYLKNENAKKWFIIIGSSYYIQIKRQLEDYGFVEYENFINGIDIENSIYSYKYRNNQVPLLSFSDIAEIEADMKSSNINVVNVTLNMDNVREFEEKFKFAEIYDKGKNKRYFRKVLEYYMSYKLLNMEENLEDDIYIDIAACTSPWAKILREKCNVNAYAIDLEKSELYSSLDYYMIQDATKTKFENNSIKAMSLQSSYEMFIKDSDINFIKECARILRPGGKVVILPLYMNKEYLSTSSPKYYNKGYADKDSKEYVRNDSTEIFFARIYDVEHLKTRVLDTILKNNMKYKIYSLPNEQVEKDGFIYLKFILELEKI